MCLWLFLFGWLVGRVVGGTKLEGKRRLSFFIPSSSLLLAAKCKTQRLGEDEGEKGRGGVVGTQAELPSFLWSINSKDHESVQSGRE